MTIKKISIAYSPDTDDAFMIEALKTGKIPSRDYEFTFIAEDIQVLNERARQGTYDISAISLAAYPALSKEYILMESGASVGSGFGPKIVARPGMSNQIDDYCGKKIAVPGFLTTAYIAAWELFGPFSAVSVPFKDITQAVLSGEVDAGILIHEEQLDPTIKGLQVVADLGILWQEKFKLPLPLGANVIRRNLDAKIIQDLKDIYLASINYGFEHRQETLKSALTNSNAKITLASADEYINMYVNENSVKFSQKMKEATDLIFTLGIKAGSYSEIPQNYFA